MTEHFLAIAVASFIKDEFCDFSDSVMQCPVRDELIKLIALLLHTFPDNVSQVLLKIFHSCL